METAFCPKLSCARGGAGGGQVRMLHRAASAKKKARISMAEAAAAAAENAAEAEAVAEMVCLCDSLIVVASGRGIGSPLFRS